MSSHGGAQALHSGAPPHHDPVAMAMLTTFFFPSGSSVAKTLGAKTVGAEALKLAQEYPVFSEVITDQEAVVAVEKFVGTLYEVHVW